MKTIILLFIIVPNMVFAQDEDHNYRWLTLVHGGLVVDPYDNDVEANWAHKTDQSTVFGADLFYSHFFANNYLQFFYGGGFESATSIEKNGNATIETEALSFVGQSGLFWRPNKNLGWKLGASLGFYLWSQAESRLKTSNLNRTIRKGSGLFGEDGPSPFIVGRLWGAYEWHPQWGAFMRIDLRDYFSTKGVSVGVSYGF